MNPNHGFPLWRRFAAGAIDGILLASAGILLFPFSKYFDAHEHLSAVITVLLCLAYFIPAQSYLWKGRSLGCRATGLVLRKRDGGFLNLTPAAFRTMVYFFTASALTTSSPAVALFVVPICLLLLTVENAFIFFHPQRRTALDILTGSLMLRSPGETPPVIAGWAKAPLTAGISGGVLVTALYLTSQLASPFQASDTGALGEAIRTQTGLELVNIGILKEYGKPGLATMYLDGPLSSVTAENKSQVLARVHAILNQAEDFKKETEVEVILSGVKHTGLLQTKFFVHERMALQH